MGEADGPASPGCSFPVLCITIWKLPRVPPLIPHFSDRISCRPTDQTPPPASQHGEFQPRLPSLKLTSWALSSHRRAGQAVLVEFLTPGDGVRCPMPREAPRPSPHSSNSPEHILRQRRLFQAGACRLRPDDCLSQSVLKPSHGTLRQPQASPWPCLPLKSLIMGR